jgi:hypothetical protein
MAAGQRHRHGCRDLYLSKPSGPVRGRRHRLCCGWFHTRARQYALSVARPPIVRRLVRLLFAVPAARAGYDVTLALAHFGIRQEWWRESFAVLVREYIRNQEKEDTLLEQLNLSR